MSGNWGPNPSGWSDLGNASPPPSRSAGPSWHHRSRPAKEPLKPHGFLQVSLHQKWLMKHGMFMKSFWKMFFLPQLNWMIPTNHQSLISWSTDIKDGMVVVYTHQSKNGNPATSCVGCFIPVTGLLTIPWYFSTVSNPTFDFGNCLWPQHMAIKTLGNHMYTVGFWGPYPKFLSDDGSTKQYTII